MGQVKQLISPFAAEKSPEDRDYANKIINKLLYEDGCVESDIRALIRKAALIRKQGAVHHSLMKDRREYKEKMKLILTELDSLNNFMQFVLEQMPDRVHEISESIRENKMYLKNHSFH
ncbi:MAG TPA: hypothetical protein ENI73_11120 [Spirochaetes bacterium]|nr:hypothetical protein [Spirochaetota bacterium]